MKEKNIYISVLRIIAMFMVVAFHCLCFYTPIFSGFGFDAPQIEVYYYIAQVLDAVDMPIFVLISAYLYSYFLLRCNKYGNNKKFLSNKAKRLLVPYLIFGVAVYLLEPGRYSWKAFIAGISHLWFLLMLFGCFVVMMLFNEYLKKSSKIFDIFIVLFLYFLYYLFDVHPFDSYYLTIFKQVVRFLPIFILVFLYVKYALEINKKVWLIGLFICPPIIFCLVVFLPQNNSMWVRFLGIVWAFSSFGYLSKTTNVVRNNIILKVINHLDRNSMGIYLIHHLLFGMLLSFTGFRELLGNKTFVAPIVLFFMLIIVSYLVSSLLNSNKYTKIILG